MLFPDQEIDNQIRMGLAGVSCGRGISSPAAGTVSSAARIVREPCSRQYHLDPPCKGSHYFGGIPTLNMERLYHNAYDRAFHAKWMFFRGDAMRDRSKDDITEILNRYNSALQDSTDADRLVTATYQEIRHLADRLMMGERQGHTLQPTALANEAYIRLFDGKRVSFEGRTHFFGIAAHVMRQILIQHARKRNAAKRGGGWQRVTLSGATPESAEEAVDVLELHEALERYAMIDERGARIVELRIFAGLTMEEIAQLMNFSRRTVQKDWRVAMMWLRREFSRDEIS